MNATLLFPCHRSSNHNTRVGILTFQAVEKGVNACWNADAMGRKGNEEHARRIVPPHVGRSMEGVVRISGLLLAAATSGIILAGLADAQEGRKGTRNYAPADAANATTEPAAAVNTLEGCIASWDAGTHISKEDWREICLRELRARAAHSGPATTP